MTLSTKPPTGDDIEIAGAAEEYAAEIKAVQSSDMAITGRNELMALTLAEMIHSERFEFFAKIVRKAGMSRDELRFFRPYVFGQLIARDYLTDQKALGSTIALVLTNFYYEETETTRIISELEKIYNKYACLEPDKYPQSAIKSLEELESLVQKILAMMPVGR